MAYKYNYDWDITTTASQVGLFNMCNRRWGFQYIERIKPEKGKANSLGIELHEIAEKYLIDGSQPDRLTKAGLLFIQGLGYLPPPGTGGIEGEITLHIDGVQYMGFLDLLSKQVPGFHPDALVLGDHKTSADPKKYGIWGAPAFLKNEQALIYALWKLLKFGGDTIDLRWLYYWTKGRPRSAASDVTLTRMQVEDAFEPVVHNTASQLIQLKKKTKSALELDPNPASCKLYGKEGCPFKSKCTDITKKQVVTAHLRDAFERIKEQDEMATISLMEQARLAKAAKAGGTPSAAPAAQADLINPPEASAQPVAAAAAAKAAPEPGPTPAAPAPVKAAKASTSKAVTKAAMSAATSAASGDNQVLKILLDELGQALQRTSSRL